eukprot:CAMPEP_0178927488 /NCGR_PEP_ID=MMETSP0786-20121207/19222_1 /TAXON_ID=186022 /ORGANISM="Thalassionema frauenfeldii, Strain CCMP 1798" /LENGTH=744 /DNA_ID=CAMNT_0020602939 /DNA_START=364 /DNA_END=2598 /DNA_ORIENTATION=+
MKSYFATGVFGDFDQCSTICQEEYKASLPCIRNKDDNTSLSWLMNANNLLLAYIGIYDIANDGDNGYRKWNRWQADGCSIESSEQESYQNFHLGDLRDIPRIIPETKAVCAIMSAIDDGNWFEFDCLLSVPCICQRPGKPSQTYLSEDRFEVIKLPPLRFFPEYVVYCFLLSLFSWFMLIKSARLLSRDRQWAIQRGSFSNITTPLSFICGSLLFFSSGFPILIFVQGNQNNEGYDWYQMALKTATFLIGFGVFFGLVAFLSTLLSTTEAVALAQGGVKAAERAWIKLFFALLLVCLLIVPLGTVMRVTGSLTDQIYYSLAGGLSLLYSIYCCMLTYRFRMLSRRPNADMTRNTMIHENIRCRCRELFRMTLVFSICFFVCGVFACLWINIFPEVDKRLCSNLHVLVFICYIALTLAFLKDSERMVKRNLKNVSSRVFVHHNYSKYDIPDAPKPDWVHENGVKQSELPSHCWSITIQDCLKFLIACRETETWRAMARLKEGNNENLINMYDLNKHFITPWTRGTGCSVAGLLSGTTQSSLVDVQAADDCPIADLFISHAWGGSVLETMRAIKAIVDVYYVPKETRIFYCPLCLYQPDDGFGLSIVSQLTLEPFAEIIKQKPKHGMYVVHTTTYEVYKRLWCVHEVDECLIAGVAMHGVFDTKQWTEKAFQQQIKAANTKEAECQEVDREMLQNKIIQRGGFERLDGEVTRFRKRAVRDLRLALKFEQMFGSNILLTNENYDTIV